MPPAREAAADEPIASRGLPGGAAGELPERALGVADPALGVRPLRRPGEECSQVVGPLLRVAPLEQEERDAVVRADQAWIELQRPLVMPDRFLRLAGLGEGDGHVEQDARIARIVPEREPVGRERRLVVTLTLQRQALVQVVQPLRLQRLAGLLAEHASPETHGTELLR